MTPSHYKNICWPDLLCESAGMSITQLPGFYPVLKVWDLVACGGAARQQTYGAAAALSYQALSKNYSFHFLLQSKASLNHPKHNCTSGGTRNDNLSFKSLLPMQLTST